MNKTGSDQRFLEGIRTGDRETINEIYEKYFDSIVNFTLKNSGNIEDAKDLFQDAIMVIYEKTKDPDFRLMYSIHTYLYTICRNIWLKKISRKKIKEVTLPEQMELINDINLDEDVTWRLKEKIYRNQFLNLDDVCQKIITSFLEGKSMEEIAQNLKLSSAAYAKKRKYKCKEKLVQLIKKDRAYSSIY